VIASLQFIRTYTGCLFITQQWSSRRPSWSGFWKSIHGVAPACVNDLCVPTTTTSGRQNLRSVSSRIVSPRHTTRRRRRTISVVILPADIVGRQNDGDIVATMTSRVSRALLVPRFQTAAGQRSFADNEPTIWNSLAPARRAPALSQKAFIHTCTDNAPVFNRPAPLRRFTRFRHRI